MIALDEDALVCDLAETYGIYDYHALPLSTVATLAAGLRKSSSRIHAKLMGSRVPFDTLLMARCVDLLSGIQWMLSEDGKNQKNRPYQIVQDLIEKDEPDEGQFEDADAFEAARAGFFVESG